MTRGAGRSFATLVCLGAVLELGGAATAFLGLHTLARCYSTWPPGRETTSPAVCMKPIPGAGFHLFVPVALLLTLLLLTAAFGALQFWRSLRAARRLHEMLGPIVPEQPGELLAAVSSARAKRVEMRRDDAPYGACVGLIRPRVVVSSALLRVLSYEELVAVLAHEERHRRRRAPFRRFLARLTVRALFYVPILGDLLTSHLVEEEIVADQESLALAGKHPLLRALTKLSRNAYPAEVALAFGDVSSLSYRLRALQGGTITRPPLSRRRIAASLAALALLALLIVWMPLSGIS
jgi:Zn-dependent protease with chaperone function